MPTDLRVPEVGESIQEVEIGEWRKRPGDAVAVDEVVVDLETDKANVEVPSPVAGVLLEIVKQQGERVAVGDVIARLDETAAAARSAGAGRSTSAGVLQSTQAGAAPARGESAAAPPRNDRPGAEHHAPEDTAEIPATPSARRELRRHGLRGDEVPHRGETLRPDDVKRFVESRETPAASRESAPPQEEPSTSEAPRRAPRPAVDETELREVVPMSLVRRRIAERLVEAQHQAALLTTFNELDMSAVKHIRASQGGQFHEQHGVKLGFMSFFVKAVVDALRRFPEINASVQDETNIVYHRYYHVGIAIGAKRGLVVPVLRNADQLSFADIEWAIDDFARRAAHNRLRPEELSGGTFTISNGGVYGSLLSTPIVNPPQSGVLGLHAIQDRPIALEGQVVIRPMMYVALTYDHRLIDGQSAVGFLKQVKQVIEQPLQLLLEG